MNRFRLPAATLLIAFGVLTGVWGLGSAPADAQADDSDPVVVEVELDDSTLTIKLNPADAAVGGLELSATGIPDLDGECTVSEGLGACAQDVDGVVHLSVINPSGWSNATVLVEAKVDGSGDEPEIELDTNVLGSDGTSVRSEGVARVINWSPDGGGPWRWVLTGLVAAAVLAAATVVGRSRRVGEASPD